MAWINVPKPTESSVTAFIGGSPIGLLLALTYTTVSSSIVSGWSDVKKPTASSWTSVAKTTASSWTPISKPTT